MVGVRLSPEMLKRIDQLVQRDPAGTTRSDIIRRLIVDALARVNEAGIRAVG